MGGLAGKRVLVLGGSSGIGLAVASAALAAGAAVTIAARTQTTLAAAQVALGGEGRVTARIADAASPAALAGLFAGAGPLDHLVVTTSESSSRHGVNQPLAGIDLAAAHAFFEGKFWNQLRAAQAALPHLAPHGSITLTSGVASRRTLPGHTIIGSVNAAIEGFVRQLAREAGPRRVNAVAPGLTRTRAYDPLEPAARVALFDRIAGVLPVGRVGAPEDVAHAYLFAMTAAYLTGTVIDIDGGHLVA
jgi:NAD(P)-dependent dehydrogenase (short-subunit alcohol dehydrogenase family)